MIILKIVVLSIIFYTTNSSPVSYQYVSFVRNSKSDSPTRRSRSFGYESKIGFSESHVWNDGDFHPHLNALSFEEHRGHITPDFSNGLEYPDPLLLTGLSAKRTADFLYRKPLFFEEINHIRALMKNQEDRIRSGLTGNRLGSLRERSPFYRFKKSFFGNEGFFK